MLRIGPCGSEMCMSREVRKIITKDRVIEESVVVAMALCHTCSAIPSLWNPGLKKILQLVLCKP